MICSRCRSEHDREGQRYCRGCHAAYMRGWRPSHPLAGAPKLKATARSYAHVYRDRGHLPAKSCAVCGDPNAEMHHPDHELPTLVTWLCRGCHLGWHAFWRGTVIDVFNSWVVAARENVTRETVSPSDLKEVA